VDVVANEATVAGLRWAADTSVTVYGQGAGWSDVVPGQRISVDGTLSLQERGPVPSIVVRARDPPDVSTAAPWWYAAAGLMRRDLFGNAAHLDQDARGLLPGLVVGDTSGITDALDADAKATGIAHLLAVSGSHFAILCGFVVVVLRRAGPRKAALGGAVTMVGLVVLVGPQPSVLRAAVMGGIGMLAILTGRTRTAVPALAAAVIVLLLVDPTLAVSAGFTLSVLASGGLVLLAPAWSNSLQQRGIPRGWAELTAIPVAAQVVTTPVIVLISGTISVVGVVANLLVAPVVAPALVIGVLAAVIGPWWPAAAGILAAATAPLLEWIATVAHTLAALPNATVPWPATVIGGLGLAALIVLLLVLLRRRHFRLVLAAVVAGIVVVLVPVQFVRPGWPAADWLLTACEVGQGDAMVLSTGVTNTAVVIDTGPDPGLVDGCLQRLDVTVIPMLILTHLHADHVDGLSGVLDGRQVSAIAVGAGREPAASWARVAALAEQRGLPIIQLSPGERWMVGDLTMTALGPQKDFHGTDSDPNNESVVLMAEHADQRILMTGDIEREAQQALLTAGAELHADVLKVPHHGSSKLLDSFVQAVGADVAVIGVGVGNDYGQPSPRALHTLARAGIGTVLRTDTDGDVSVGTDGDALTVTTRGATTAARGR
jgi:competence protein ComEC